MNERHVIQLLDWIKDTVASNQPTHLFDFLSGMSCFALDFSICKDGERFFGSSGCTTREFNEAMKRYMENHSL